MNDSLMKGSSLPLLTIPEIDRILKNLKVESPSAGIAFPLNEAEPEGFRERLADIIKKIDDASLQMADLFKSIRQTEHVPIAEIKQTIIPAVEQAAEIPYVYYLFDQMNQRDEYTYTHNICVGIISANIGRWLGLSKEDQKELTLAASLHDIGKMMVREEILQKPGKLTASEYQEVKLHTVHGYELLKKVPGLPQSVSLVALQHHERENGEGYPLGLKGGSLHLFSKIVAVADVFHAMSSSRVYHQAVPFYKVIRQMNDDVFGRFDPKILLKFLQKMMESLVGSQVLLTDRRLGRIIMVDPYDPLDFLVQAGGEIIDLRFRKDLEIEKILGA